MRKLLLALLVAALALVAAGCGGDDEEQEATPTTTAAAEDACAKENLELVSAGKLTVGTDNPAYPPWFGGSPAKGSKWKISDPSSGQGFESAVAYAVAKELGFSRGEVQWKVVPFNQSFKPGPKDFDFDVNQISYSPQRAKAVGFSRSYYDVNQALVALKGKPIAKAKTQDDLKDYKLGAPVGTTSYDYIVNNIEPSKDPSVYDTLNDGISALKARQIDGLVVDLPTAFYVTAAQVENSTIVGQFPAVGEQEYFGMVFEKGSTLVPCVNQALQALENDGALDEIQREWLADKANAPVLK